MRLGFVVACHSLSSQSDVRHGLHELQLVVCCRIRPAVLHVLLLQLVHRPSEKCLCHLVGPEHHLLRHHVHGRLQNHHVRQILSLVELYGYCQQRRTWIRLRRSRLQTDWFGRHHRLVDLPSFCISADTDSAGYTSWKQTSISVTILRSLSSLSIFTLSSPVRHTTQLVAFGERSIWNAIQRRILCFWRSPGGISWQCGE